MEAAASTLRGKLESQQLSRDRVTSTITVNNLNCPEFIIPFIPIYTEIPCATLIKIFNNDFVLFLFHTLLVLHFLIPLMNMFT